jgi:hypothetical protein
MQQEKPTAKLSKDDDPVFSPVAASIAALWQVGKKAEAINILLGWTHVGGQNIPAYLEGYVTLLDGSGEEE